jgi:hypothetical protein
MTSRHTRLPWLSALVSSGLLAGCGADQVAGNSVETENTLAAVRILSVDSLLPAWNRPTSGTTVATLRFDRRNFDFSRSRASGRDLRLERLDSTPLAFEILHWDSLAARGRLRVRIDNSLLAHGARIRMLSNLPLKDRTDPVATWIGISESQRLALTSVSVDDFEHGSLLNLLPSPTQWYSSASDSCTVTPPSLMAAGHGRTGTAVGIGYSAPQQFFRYSLLGTQLGPGPRSLRSLDSLVFWARGSGFLSVAFDHLYGITGPKSWKRDIPLDTAWKRIRIRPEDLAPADGIGDNAGWNSVRDSITHLTFLVHTGSELMIDEVRLHGIDRDDLR